MRKIISKIYRRILLILPRKIAHKILYYRELNKSLNLDNPRDFNEKIQWLILNRYNSEYGKLADKYLVRNYVEKKGYSNLLPKLYGVYNKSSEINIDELPDKFVLKPNNGSGNIEVCNNKEKFNFTEVFKRLDDALRDEFWKNNLEYHYSYIEPKIICEEYLEDNDRVLPLDYKFYCYNGKVECVLMCSNREKKLNLDYYDLDWNYLNYSKPSYRSNEKFEKPENLSEMVEISSKLSEGFEFVRVDLYNINGKIYFGELTFTPAAGLVYYNTDEALKYLGELIELKK